MNVPQDVLAPLREISTDIRPMSAAPLIEKGSRQRQARRFTALGCGAAVLVASAGLGAAYWPSSGATMLAAPGAAQGPGLIARAGTAVLAAGTASIDLTVQVPTSTVTDDPSAAAGPAPARPSLPSSVHATGAVDFARHISTMKVSADVGDKPLSVQVLATPTKTYVSHPLKPGTWIEVSSLNALVGLDAKGAPLDAQRILDQLPVDATDVTYVGDETVRGTPTSHFRGTLAPNPSSPLPFDIWLDGAGLPRRLTVSRAPGGTMVGVSLELYGFGKTVTISTPAASSVVPFSAAEGELKALIPQLSAG